MTNEAKKKQLPAFLVLTIISLVAAVVLAVTNEVTKGPIAAHAAAARTAAFQAVLPAAGYNEVVIPEGNDSVTGLFEAVDESGASLGYTVVASASGYAGPVAVTLGVGNDGMVTGAVIGDTSFAETAGFGMRWKEETNRWEQFQLIDTANGGSIEAISGATVTSNAVLSATNAAVNCVNEVRGVAARDVITKGTPAAPVIEQTALVGGIHEGSAQGFQSEVRVQLTMDDAGVVTGLNIDATKETPGFGTRATEEAAFAQQFVGKSAPFAIGSGIDALTGATVTSKAVVEAVNAACASPENPDAVPFNLGGDAAEEEPAVATSAEPAPAGAITASAPGFAGGDVHVTITKNEDGTIATLTIDVSDQVPPVCDMVLAESFVNQFIGKTGPFVKGENVDIVTGATFTSDGVIAAVNAALEAPAEEAPASDALTASAPGFAGGDVHVSVTFNEDGTIATLTIDVSDQVPPVCDMVLAESFVNQFIGKTGPFVKGENVDIVTGATFTSDGVINAVNSLIPTNDMSVTGEEGPAAPAGNELTAAAPGFGGADVGVTVTLNEDGTIATLTIDVSKQLPPVCDLVLAESFVNQFVGKTGPFVKGENVDIVTGATFTSEGVINAVNSLFAAEEAPAEEPAAEAAPAELTAAAPGFGGADVGVTVTLNEDGTIATLTIDVSKQLPPVCDLVLAESFVNQFVGKAGPFTDIDIVTGATFTSEGVINAVNSLFPAEEAPAEEPAAEAAPAELTAAAPGFGGADVGVTVTLNEDGTIATLTIDVSKQLPPVCDLVLADSFVNQFVGKAGPFTDIDIVTGATFTSEGVINAVNSLFAAEEAPAEEPAAEAAPAELTAAAPGFGGADVGVTVTLNEDGTIATLTIDVSKQLPPVCDLVLADSFVNQFVGKAGPFTDIDIVTGATFTSEGVINAVNSLFPAEEAPVEEPAAEAAPAELTAAAPGFGGADVGVTVTLNEDGTIATLTIDVSKQLPPVCDLVLAESFVNQFVGKAGPFTDIDIVTGATFTSEGVINAVNSLFPAEEAPAEEPAAEAAPAELTAAAPGFGGADVGVTVTLNEDGTIATLTIDVSKQLPPVCDLVLADSFVNQFVGKAGPFTDIDIVTGATFTSEGVINAVNSLFPAEEAPAEEPAAEAAPAELTAAAPGFGGADVGVTVTLNEDGTIATLTIDVSKQLPPVCDLVLAESFVNQFVGKAGPFTDIDIVTGATFTSEGVINAVNSLFAAEEAPAEEPAAEAAPAELTAAAPGFGGADVGVTVTLNEDGTIATLTIDVSKQLPPVCDLVLADSFVNQFVGKAGPFVKGENVDIVTGATFTSEGVINAVNSLFPAEEAPAEEPAAEAAPAELTAAAPGFGGADVGVTVTLNEDGTIATLTIDVSKQLPPVCDLVLADSFVNQFVGKAGPFVKGENVDIVTGATFTSDGVINAVNSLFAAE